jgi:subtilisin-like proprotein convertase family protein
MRFCNSGGSALAPPINVKVNFATNSSFTVTDHYGTLTQGNWKLKIVDTNLWGLDLTSQSDFLYGRILFCENNVMFNNSYIDGCDNVFYK